MTINPAVLTVGLNGMVEKTYDGTTAATLNAGNYTLGGVVDGDTVGIANTTGGYDTKNAGSNKSVTVDGLTLTGSDARNYQLSSTSVSGNVGKINPAALTVTVNPATQWFGVPNPQFAVTYTGLVGNDTPQSLAGRLSYITPATVDSLPGRYTVSASGLSSPNYIIQYVDGILTITENPPKYDTALISAHGSGLDLMHQIDWMPEDGFWLSVIGTGLNMDGVLWLK